MWSISGIVSILLQNCEMVGESPCGMFELAVINNIVIYFRNNLEFAAKYQSHRLYRVELIHQLVQPLLCYKASGEILYHGAWR